MSIDVDRDRGSSEYDASAQEARRIDRVAARKRSELQAAQRASDSFRAAILVPKSVEACRSASVLAPDCALQLRRPRDTHSSLLTTKPVGEEPRHPAEPILSRIEPERANCPAPEPEVRSSAEVGHMPIEPQHESLERAEPDEKSAERRSTRSPTPSSAGSEPNAVGALQACGAAVERARNATPSFGSRTEELIQRIAQFASAGRDSVGNALLRLDLRVAIGLPLQLVLVALGEGRISIHAVHSQGERAPTKELGELLHTLRGRGVRIARVTVDDDDG